MVANIISGSLIFATALLFGALGGMLSERAGVTNLGVEGFMISGLSSPLSAPTSPNRWGWAGSAHG